MVKNVKEKLRFGTAGIPHGAKGKGVAAGVEELHRLGLECMEIEFVYGVRMSEEKALEVRKAAVENDVALTVHAPYYINLNSPEPEKYEAGIERIMKSARIGHICGARSLTFHAAFRMGADDEALHLQVRKSIERIKVMCESEGLNITIAPELTGKASQWGSIDDHIRLSKELDGVRMCIDFSHHYARHCGKFNDYESFAGLLDKLEGVPGVNLLNGLHMHVSGIDYGPGGEKKHRVLKESRFNYRELLRALAHKRVTGWLICESPGLENDALLLKEYYESPGGSTA